MSWDPFTDASPWEAATQVLRSGVDPTRQVRGPAWLVVLSEGHLERLGDLDAAPGDLTPLPEGRALLTLAPDPDGLTPSLLAAARVFLRPLLPQGQREPADYRGRVPYRL